MTDKRKLHHFQTKLRPFRTIYLLIAIFICLGISIYALRQNNLTAISLREEVLKADKAGGDTESALKNLRIYIYKHMNTNLSAGATSTQQPIQLKYTYERLVAAEKQRVSAVNEKVYAEAQVICEKQFPVGLSGSGRIPCIEDYVAKNGTKEQPIQDALYKFSFTSPKWSSDLAGIMLLITGVLVSILIAKLWINHWLKNQMHDHM